MDGKDVCCVEKAKWGGVEDHVGEGAAFVLVGLRRGKTCLFLGRFIIFLLNLKFYKEHFMFSKKNSQTTFWPSKYNVKLFFLLEMDGGIVGFLVLTH